MVLNTCEMWSDGIKIAFFPQKCKKIAKQLGFGPKPPSVICLSKLVCLHTSPKLHIFIFSSGFKRSPIWKLFVKCQTRPRLLIIQVILRYLCPTKSCSSFENFWWRHCMSFLVWPSPNQKSWLSLCTGGGGGFGPKSLIVPPKRE